MPAPELGGDAAHRHGLEALGIGDRQRGLGDLLAREARRGGRPARGGPRSGLTRARRRARPGRCGAAPARARAPPCAPHPRSCAGPASILRPVRSTLRSARALDARSREAPPFCANPPLTCRTVYCYLDRTMYEHTVLSTTKSAPGVVTEGLGKRYDDLWALRDLDLQVPAGSVLGLLGHNGAGKTTAIRILTTLALPTTGRASVAGFDVVEQPGEVRARLGLAGQSATVDGLLDRAREPRDGRAPLPPVARRGAQPRRRAARASRPHRGRRPPRAHLLGRHAPPARPGREPGRRSRRCCSSTSRPPASIRRAATTSGTCCASSSPTGPRSC